MADFFLEQSRSCVALCQRNCNGIRFSPGSHLRKYHATRLLCQQGQPEPQNQDESGDTLKRDAYDGPRKSAGRIEETRQATSVQGLSTEQPGIDKQETPIDPTELNNEEQELKTAVRGFLRKVPSSVAVITVKSIDPVTSKHVPMGVAVSSLSSVTLDPPTISFNIKQPSKTLDAIRAAKGRFRVHFPGADQGGANIVELFCRGNHQDAYNLRFRDLKLYVPSYSKDKRSSLAPQIRDDSIRGAMECTVTHELHVADHVIIAARVNSLKQRQKTSRDPTIAYVDGGYTRSEGKIAVHGKPKSSVPGDEKWSVWDYSLFLGEQERRDYVEHIKTIVKGNPYYLNNPTKAVSRKFERSLSYPPGALGINTSSLISECSIETGHSNVLNPDLERIPVLYDFYGRLTPSVRAKILDRAVRLVKEDARFLSLSYRTFLSHLSVCPSSRDLLPSDITNHLRVQGLLGEFEPNDEEHGSNHKKHFHIQKLEQVEHKVRKYFRTLSYDTALKINLDGVMDSIGEDQYGSVCLGHCRSRLLAETHPQRLVDSRVDIAGDVTRDEARVVLSRIKHFLQVNNLREFEKKIALPPYEILRLSGVHPTITGLDIEYLLAKIKHLYLYYSEDRLHYLAGGIHEMLAPWFDSRISWHELETRVKQFVQKLSRRATSWSNHDKLAAMGLNWDATVILNVQSGKEIQQPLNHGHVFDTLLAKELKNYYGNGTDKENQAIAKYLKETYNFEIHSRPTAYAPHSATPPSSSEGVQAAVMETLEAAVSTGKLTLAEQDATQEGSNAAAHNDMPPTHAKNSSTGWTSYSLNGRMK